jgi:hypothetical protein
MDGNGWEEHKRNVLFRLDTVEEDVISQRGRCADHSKNFHLQHELLLSKISDLNERLANLEGRLLGFLAAASVLGGLVSLFLQLALKFWHTS